MLVAVGRAFLSGRYPVCPTSDTTRQDCTPEAFKARRPQQARALRRPRRIPPSGTSGLPIIADGPRSAGPERQQRGTNAKTDPTLAISLDWKLHDVAVKRARFFHPVAQ